MAQAASAAAARRATGATTTRSTSAVSPCASTSSPSCDRPPVGPQARAPTGGVLMGFGRTTSVALRGVNGFVVDVEAHVTPGLPGFAISGLGDSAVKQSSDRIKAVAALIERTAGEPAPRHGQPLAGRTSARSAPASTSASSSPWPPRWTSSRSASSPTSSTSVRSGSTARCVRCRGCCRSCEQPPWSGCGTSWSRSPTRPRRGSCRRARAPGGRRHGARPALRRPREGTWRGGGAGAAGRRTPTGAACGTCARSSARPTPSSLSRSPRREGTTCCSRARRAPARRCSPSGCPGCCRRSTRRSRWRSRRSTRSSEHSGPSQDARLITRPPFVAPHHGASQAAVVGGGSGHIRPGAITQAHRGVLFLDETPEFDKARPPVAAHARSSAGRCSIARAQETVTFPARFQLVMAANPCPCGHGWGKGLDCTCTPLMRRAYFGRLSGPLLDRVDLQVHVQPPGLSLAGAGARGSPAPSWPRG